MLKIENASYNFSDYCDFSLSASGITRKKILAFVAFFLVCAALFFLKFFFPIEILAKNAFFIDIFFLLGVFFVLFSIWYIFVLKSTYDSAKSISKPECIELSEEYIKSSSECMKLNLPKNLIKRIIFKKNSVYIFYFNHAVLLLKKNCENESHWKEIVDFVKQNYVGENVQVKNM